MAPSTRLCLVSAILVAFCWPALGQLNDEFLDPPKEYRPKFRYWLPDASISSDIVARDIHAAKDVGAGGLEFLPFYYYGAGEETLRRQGHTPVPKLPEFSKYGFGTPAFVSLFKDSLQAAQNAGIIMDYALGANQGQGVPSEVSTAGLAVELLMGNTTITPKGSFSAPVPQARQPSATLLGGLGFMHPLEQFGTPNLTAVIAYEVLSPNDNRTGTRTVHLNESSFINLMSLVKDGWSLQWTPPDLTKSWKIFTFWEAYTNQRSCDGGPNATDFLGNGSWTVDKFSQAGAARVTDFWDQYILSDEEVAGLLKSVGKYAWEDSMEVLASLYWTPGMLNRFNMTHGYDLTPYLPLLFRSSNSWNGGIPVYDEIYGFGNDTNIGNSLHQLDYRQILNDGYQDYLSHFREWSHSIGTEYSAQPAYNLPLQMLSDISLLDAPEGESLGFSQNVDVYRQFSGAAHLAGKNVISSELGAVNVPPYTLTIPSLLQQIKRSLAGGFTMHVIHGFPCSTTYANTTWPGYTTFGYEFTEMWNQVQPAWHHMKDYLDFVGRSQWAMQQGSPKVDLALYLYASPWSPKMQYNSTNLKDLGYTYEYLGPDNLVSPQAFIEDGKLGIPEYKALIFHQQSVITVEAAQALINMTSRGFPVIFVGAPPSQGYPANASTQSALESAMTRLLSQPNVYRTTSIEDIPSILSKIRVNPRVALNCSSGPVYPTYRSSDAVDYVYLFNDQNKATTCSAAITASGVAPYIYDAWTGTQSPLLQYTYTNSTLSIPIALKANESTILALNYSSPHSNRAFTRSPTTLLPLPSSPLKIRAIITKPTTLTHSSGTTKTYNTTLPPPTNLTTWSLVISDWHSAPNRLAIQTAIKNHTFSNIPLIPWSQLSASLTPVSGVGHYTTHFRVPTLTTTTPTTNTTLIGILTLPPIQHTARIYLNGAKLPPFDPVNPVVLLQGLKQGEEYELRVEVTTTLFNRIKAEAGETWVIGMVAGVEQPLYRTMPVEGYGLVGRVGIEWGVVVEVGC